MVGNANYINITKNILINGIINNYAFSSSDMIYFHITTITVAFHWIQTNILVFKIIYDHLVVKVLSWPMTISINIITYYAVIKVAGQNNM